MFTHEVDAGGYRHIQRRGSWSGVQPNERARIPRGKCQPNRRPVDRGRSRSIGAYATHGAASRSIHPRTVRLTECSPRAQNPDAMSRGTRGNTVRLRHVETVRVPRRHAAPSPSQLPSSLHRLAKEHLQRPPDFLSGHAHEDGK